MDSLFKRMFLLNLTGKIDNRMTQNTYKILNKFTFQKPNSLVVTINSEGGILTQAKIIKGMIHNFCVKKKIPLICIGED